MGDLLQPWHLIVLAVVAFLLFGAKRLPGAPFAFLMEDEQMGEEYRGRSNGTDQRFGGSHHYHSTPRVTILRGDPGQSFQARRALARIVDQLGHPKRVFEQLLGAVGLTMPPPANS